MLRIVSSATLTELAAHLGQVLSEPSADPLEPDWVAVPSAGTTRWLRLELARTLGAGPAGTDGVAANIEMPFPSALGRAVLDAGLRDQHGLEPRDPLFDPWRLDHLVWSVLEALAEHRTDGRLASLAQLPDGATRFGQARRVADLFDRYAVHRPDMVRAWAHGRDVDPQGAALHESYAWQPHLWRLVRSHIGAPSAPELLPTLLPRVARGELELELPSRLAVFGLSTLPGGRTFLDLASALGQQRDVHVLLVDPSPAATARVRPRAVAHAHERGPDAGPRSRADDTTASVVAHPLVAAWTHVRREATVLLAEAEALQGLPAPEAAPAPAPSPAAHLLARVQADIRADTPPDGTHVLDPADRSIQLHLCHGPTRQLEVARDAIFHLLAQDPTLREDDIVVLSPDVARFSPLVEATFGPPADRPDAAAHHGPPPLRWRVTDRSLRAAHPLLDALAALLELIGGRFEATAVQQLCALAPVRQRWGFDDDGLEQIGRWVDDTDLRWGLDADHRTRWGLPPDHEANTWRAALDQLLTGVAVADDEPTFGPGPVVAVGVEGGQVATLGSLADLLARLEVLALEVATPRPAHEWTALLATAADELFEVDRRDDWQRARLRQVLSSITEQAQTSAGPSTVPLGLADLRRLLADQLEGRPPRASFLDGGLTISSLQPLRGVPHRVVCIVGLDDQGGAGPAGLLGDDLIAQQPLVGDRDPRADERQALLEALLAASDHLIVTRNGHDVRTNQPLPAAVALAELRDTIVATLHPERRDDALAQIERVHARQAFDDAELLATPTNARTWSFDPRALAGARARRARSPLPTSIPERLAAAPAQVVPLSDLHDFLAHPVRSFYRNRLGLALAARDEAGDDQLPVALSSLQSWSLGSDLLRARTLGNDEARWLAIEAARGAIPPGVLGQTDLRTIHDEVELLLAAADAHPGARRALERHDIDIDELPGAPGTRVVGTVGSCRGGAEPGPAELTYTRSGPKLTLRLWLNLLALTVAHPTVPWRAVGIARGPSGKPTSKPPVVTELQVAGQTDHERRAQAAAALGVVVDLYQRGQQEALPLFADTSHALATGSGASAAWGGYDRGDALDRYNRQAFGALSFEDLLALPTLPHDPSGSTVGRALRYATVLWDTYARSVQEPDA